MSGSAAEGPAGPAAARPPALQVIVLGAGGGPQEANTTAFLVRSTAEGWRRGSVVALDAGVLLSSITRILEQSLPPGLRPAATESSATGSATGSTDGDGDGDGDGGDVEVPSLSVPYTLTTGPFAGLEVPHASVAANASFIQRSLIDTYLITHPHLDHISGFVVNTAGLPGTRPKRLAGLPSTISAFKNHIFNNIIWPNLSDENNGAGLVTYMRLVEGGSPALGDGEGRGYVEVSDGLAVKMWSVSHGHCIERHSHRGSGASPRIGSMDAGNVTLPPPSLGLLSPRIVVHHGAGSTAGLGGAYAQPPSSSPLALHSQPSASASNLQQQQQQLQQDLLLQQLQAQQQVQPVQPAPLMQQAQQTQQAQQPLSAQQPPQAPQLPASLSRRNSLALLPGLGGGASAVRRASLGMALPGAAPPGESVCVYDSSAYFIRDVATGREVLMFGDVEPDSVSLSPRNCQVWQEAAPKIAARNLAAIFIECSYDDSQPLDRLYGHLAPRFVVEEMAALAVEVQAARVVLEQQQQQQQREKEQKQRDREGRKRKRYNGDEDRANSASVSRPTSHSRRKTETAPIHTGGEVHGGGASALDDPVSPRTTRPPPQQTTRGATESNADAAAPFATPAETAATTPHVATPTADLLILDGPEAASTPAAGNSKLGNDAPAEARLPLQGLKVVIIHVKETLKDGPLPGDIILEQLQAYEARNPLGCEYIVSHAGQSFYF